MGLGNEEYTARKDRRKAVRVFGQFCVLLGVAFLCAMALFTWKTFTPYHGVRSEDRGFIALSYFGVDRVGSQSLIGMEQLRAHLQALKDQGYVTITQEDIQAYYQSGKLLPEKSLFLMFEDGRRDTAIFSQKMLEDLNYKATMMSYPEKFEKKDTKFLLPPELKELEKTSFWELGSNGYRLAFINVFDRYDNYLGELEPLEHARVAPYLERKYNHYLMDYIRDEYGIPKESYNKMKERITYDYTALRDIYTKELGYIPAAYVLMHANTGSFGNNDKVSAVNAYWIKMLFKMNFNREGFCWNRRNSSVYDLTRMQPQSYWSVNHLLMRIKYDINQDLDFVKGDAARQAAWEVLKGAMEVKDETLLVTSLPNDQGLARLKNSEDFEDVYVSARLRGNKFGLQRIYLRANEDLSQFLSVYIRNNVLYVTERNSGSERGLFQLDLDELDGKEKISIPEDKKAAEMREAETFSRYARSAHKAKVYGERLKDKDLEKPATVEDGAPEYKPDASLHARGDWRLRIALKGSLLSVFVDEKEAVADLPVSVSQSGLLYLEGSGGNFGVSQRNLADDVYDGVFEEFVVTENTGASEEKILYESRYQGMDAVEYTAKKYWETVIDWFVTNL